MTTSGMAIAPMADRPGVEAFPAVTVRPDTLGGRDRAPSTIRLRLPAGISIDQLPQPQGRHFEADHDHVALAIWVPLTRNRQAR